jgi:uncharacterized protein (DUF1697 family)
MSKQKPSLVAFLRGINVGGHTIKMADLKEAFESLGSENVKTVLASGNVLFDHALFGAAHAGADALTNTLETGLKQRFGYAIPVLLRTIVELQQLAESQPFQGVDVTPATRLYVTFLAAPHRGAAQGALAIPYTSPDGNYRILRATEREVCSVLTHVEGERTTDLMAILEKEYGRNVTTRNWNTVTRLLG